MLSENNNTTSPQVYKIDELYGAPAAAGAETGAETGANKCVWHPEVSPVFLDDRRREMKMAPTASYGELPHLPRDICHARHSHLRSLLRQRPPLNSQGATEVGIFRR